PHSRSACLALLSVSGWQFVPECRSTPTCWRLKMQRRQSQPFPSPEDFPFGEHVRWIVSSRSEGLCSPTPDGGMIRKAPRRCHRPQLVLETLPSKHHTPFLDSPITCQQRENGLQQAQQVNA